MKKTSAEWAKIYAAVGTVVLDPDGWDRDNFDYSWFKEEIDEVEFKRRLMNSTIQSKSPFVEEVISGVKISDR